jgi:hypothetical protein
VLELSRLAGQQGSHPFLVANADRSAVRQSTGLRWSGAICVRRVAAGQPTKEINCPIGTTAANGIDPDLDEGGYRRWTTPWVDIALTATILAELRDVPLGPLARFRQEADDLFYPSLLHESQLSTRYVLEWRWIGYHPRFARRGTGKTTTLVQAILETIRRAVVCWCAPSNTAGPAHRKLAEQASTSSAWVTLKPRLDLLLKHTSFRMALTTRCAPCARPPTKIAKLPASTCATLVTLSEQQQRRMPG